jgi:hypothetical protein
VKISSELLSKIKFKKSITLCAIDSLFADYSAQAIETSSKYMDFDNIILFSDKKVSGIHKSIIIDPIKSLEDYNNFLIRHLNNYIQTEFVLIVQWDGFIINPQAWTNEFFDYDYIGARWPQYNDEHSVGNGGFSLRSKRLLEALQKLNIADASNTPEDELICRTLRIDLERSYKILFANKNVADKFSYEQIKPSGETFGFHGFWNMVDHIDEEYAFDIISGMPVNYFRGYLIMKTFMSCFAKRSNNLMLLIYNRVVREIGEDTFYKTLTMALQFDEQLVITALKKSRKLMIEYEISGRSTS